MALDFTNYLLLSDNSTGCDNDLSSEFNDVSNTGNGCNGDARVYARQQNEVLNGGHEPSSGYPCTDDYNDDVFSKRPSAEVNPPVEREYSTHRIATWKTGSQESLSCNDKNEQRWKKQQRFGDPELTSSSVEYLRKILQKLKTTMKMYPAGPNDPDYERLIRAYPDGQDTDQMSPLRQPAYHSRRSLPGRLTDDHVTHAKHEARKKYSRRGSVKFADEFGLNLNTFAMIPSRFGAQAQTDVNRNLHSDNRKWKSDDRISTDIHRNTATDGFKGMGERWNFMSDLGLFLKRGDEDDSTLWPDWDSFEFRRSKKQLLLPSEDPPNYRRLRRVNRSSKEKVTKSETPATELAKQEAEAEVDGQRHKFRLRFEQPFADLDRFQRKLRENFLCLENVRVDGRSSRSGDDDLGGTGPSRKGQGTTILCSIKVRHRGRGITVFSRCTDNDWATYADLPAQHLSGVANLGFDYDTYCFAVRKPVQPPREDCDMAMSSGPTSVVEFALCCRVTNEGGTVSHWDNNDGANYRIEWFDD